MTMCLAVPRRWVASLPFALTALLVATAAPAQDKTAEVDRIFSWATPGSPGCACAVTQNGRVVVRRAYGTADLERAVPITSETIFDAGSLTKQFVAASVLLLAEEKRLALSDDVRKYVPELPDYGHTITIDHLLTHTSGIRDWTGILPLTAVKKEALAVILRQRGLNFLPGEEWSYSNSGYVLAREIVARVSGMTFAEFTRKRLFEPLGMKSTSFRVHIRDVVERRAQAYDKEGDGWRVAILLDENRGGGGIMSTAVDLALWNEALTHHRLGTFVSEKLQEPAKLNNGRKLGYGRGLMLDTYRGAREIAHSGSADGYKSWLGRYPEHGLSIAIMCNSGDDTDRRGFAHRIVDLFAPHAGSPEPETGPPPAVTGDAAVDLDRKAGLFFSEKTGEPLRLAVDRGRFRVAGGPGLVPVSKDRFRRWGATLFFMSQDLFELNFLTPDQFELKSSDGTTTRYRRARPFAPASDVLEAFAGRYESDEIGTLFAIEPKGDGLQLRLEHAPLRPLEFKPVDDDTFQFSRITVRFRRDEAGKVTGLDFSNPMIRNVAFKRLSGQASGS